MYVTLDPTIVATRLATATTAETARAAIAGATAEQVVRELAAEADPARVRLILGALVTRYDEKAAKRSAKAEPES